jgi:hypothetical protein
MNFAVVAYVLCAVVSAACAGLLLRSWQKSRSGLVLWAGVAFVFLTASNVTLVADLFTTVDLATPRALLIAIGLALLIYGLAWEDQA